MFLGTKVRCNAPLAGVAAGGTGVRIEIICTGDEVLTGKIVNTNFSYMTQKLEDVGLSVVPHTTDRPTSSSFWVM